MEAYSKEQFRRVIESIADGLEAEPATLFQRSGMTADGFTQMRIGDGDEAIRHLNFHVALGAAVEFKPANLVYKGQVTLVTDAVSADDSESQSVAHAACRSVAQFIDHWSYQDSSARPTGYELVDFDSARFVWAINFDLHMPRSR